VRIAVVEKRKYFKNPKERDADTGGLMNTHCLRRLKCML
jgi:hypothetical protein